MIHSPLAASSAESSAATRTARTAPYRSAHRLPRPTSVLAALALAVATLVPATASAAPAAATVTVSSTSGGVYQPTDPRRVMSFVPMGPASTYTLTITGAPAGATAVQLNVTATAVSQRSYVSTCAGGTAVDACRASSALNPEPGYDIAGSVIVPLGSGNTVTFYNNQGSLKLIADLEGFFVPADSTGSLFSPVAPYRALSFAQFGPKESKVLTLSGVPAGATAVALNVTSTRQNASTYISACPTGQALAQCSASSNLNALPGVDVANAVVVKLGGAAQNQVTLYNNAGTTSIIADVTGYYVDAASASSAAGRLLPVAPTRVMSFQPMGAGTAVVVTLPNVPVGATAAAVNLTSTRTTSTSYVSACPGSTALSTCTKASSLNPRANRDISNSALLQLGGPNGNQIIVYNNAGSTAMIADLQGFFVPPATIGLPQPPPTTTPPPTVIASGLPGPTNTGVPAGAALTVVNGDYTVSTPGAVVSNLDIRGYLRIKADNVTVKNTIVRGRDGLTTSMSLVQNTSAGLQIVDSELVAAYPSYYIDGFVGSNVTFTRVNIHGVVDTIKLTGDNVLIQDSWLHDNSYYAMTPSGHDTHTDNIQIQKGNNITVRNTVMSGSRNAAMMITQDSGPVSNVVWSGNHADGGSCTINIAEKTYGPIRGLNLSNNIFGYNTEIDHCSILMPDTTKAISTVASNYYTDGAVVAVKRG